MIIGDLSHSLVDALRKRGHSDESIERMKPARAFNEFCEWHGLIGWGPTLYDNARLCLEQEASLNNAI